MKVEWDPLYLVWACGDDEGRMFSWPIAVMGHHDYVYLPYRWYVEAPAISAQVFRLPLTWEVLHFPPTCGTV